MYRQVFCTDMPDMPGENFGYIYIFFNCYILATKSFLRGSDDRLCKIKMIGEIRQNFTKASASVGLILATALIIVPNWVI